MSRLHRKPKGCKISQKLKIELQSLVAYGSYDDLVVLLDGNSMKKQQITESVYNLYMPSNDPHDERVSNVDLFLQGKGRFRALFGCDRPVSISKTDLIVPGFLHNIPDIIIRVSSNMVNKQLLMSKSLSNNQHIKAERIYMHVKEVKENWKKAFTLCTDSSSPYKSFHATGTYPTGTNWYDYVEWLRIRFYRRYECVHNDNATGKKKDIPKETYFKGFFAFAIWGFIPPPGFDEFKSMAMKEIGKRHEECNTGDNDDETDSDKSEEYDPLIFCRNDGDDENIHDYLLEYATDYDESDEEDDEEIDDEDDEERDEEDAKLKSSC